MVVFVGVTVPLENVELYPAGLLAHEYLCPMTDVSPMEMEAPWQIVLSIPALVAGNGFTVITTEFVLLHPVAVIVSVKEYVVVKVGLTDGLARVDTKPDGLEAQAYVWPPMAAAPMEVEANLQILLFAPALANGSGLMVMIAESVFLQPVAVMVSVR